MNSQKGVHPYAEQYYKPGKEPGENFVLCAYRLTPGAGLDMKEAASAVAAESSTGTWTEVDSEVAARLPSWVYQIEGDVAFIAYHPDLFEAGSLPNVLSSLAGNIFGMKAVNRIRLEDMRFPKSFMETFPGPSKGLAGVREMMGIFDRPMTGSTIKPKLGLTAKEHARRCYETLRGGIDTVKDDENLGSQPFNNFDDRVKYTLELVQKAEAETGEKKGYWCNITAGTTEEMLRRAELVKKHGGRFVMIDFITAGFTGLGSLRQAVEALGLSIHGHRAMHSALDRLPNHGIEYRVLVKWARMGGIDHVHVGTGVGKLEGGVAELRERNQILREAHSRRVEGMFFDQEWGRLKPSIPVASGGLHPGHVPALYNIFGKDAFWAFGGGTHGHPDGSREGARAVRDAVEGVVAGKSLDQIAKTSKALRRALDIWQEVKF